MTYNSIRSTSLRIRPDLASLERTFAVLNFPEQWRRPISDARLTLIKNQNEGMKVPIRSLNQSVNALIPGVTSIQPWSAMGDKPWLVAERPFDLRTLRMLVDSWLQVQLRKYPTDQLHRLRDEVSRTDLTWREVPINLAHWTQAENGTAMQAPGVPIELYTLLADYAASLLCATSAVFQFGGRELRFYRVPTGRGAEVMSWPPMPSSKPGWTSSIVMHFSTITRPFRPYPLLYCEFGVRRWAGDKIKYADGHVNAYISAPLPWLQNGQQGAAFATAPILWFRSNGDQDKKSYSMRWGRGDLADIMSQLGSIFNLPEAQAIVERPSEYLERPNSQNIGIVWRNGMSPEHPDESGMMPIDRRPLFEQVVNHLAEAFIQEEDFERVALQVPHGEATPKNPFFMDAEEEDGRDQLAEQRWRAIGEVVPASLRVEIWFQTERFRDQLAATLCELLEVPQPTTFPMTIQRHGLTLTVAARALGSIGAELVAPDQLKWKDSIIRAIQDRIEDISNRLDKLTSPCIAYIELHNASGFKKELDPKRALRLGFAQMGRLTQFLTPIGDNEKPASLASRMKNGALDALRQLGVLPQLPSVLNLPQSVNYVGIWLIKQFRATAQTKEQLYLPVMVHIDSVTRKISAFAHGFNQWTSYREALQWLAEGKAHGVKTSSEAAALIKQVLRRDLLDGDTVIWCHAQNLRQAWSWIQDRNLTQDKIAFDQESPRPITEWPNLRLIRVRDSDGGETPQWYAVDEETDEQGFSAGLFSMGERVFASTTAKPRQFRRLSLQMSRATPGPMRPKPAWNPSILEVTLAALQPGDDPAAWATLTHQLRRFVLQYDEALTLPLVLHLACQMEEYVLAFPESSEDA